MGIDHVVTQVAKLIGDASFENFNYEDVETAVQQRRVEMRYETCTPLETRASGGAITYLTYTAPNGWGWWDEAATFTNSNYTALTPATSDWNAGRWTFSSEPTRPVRITGFTYDVYAAAADLLENRAAYVSEDISAFSVAHGSFTYANKRTGPMQMAQRYRAMQRPSVATVYRTDINP
ncbi:hypothetical protein KC887_01215 [Candidatus Kaiserbacteria bacterium]|nr:hypothetical protein [Candidatus Kaiserbacteria bacterium]